MSFLSSARLRQVLPKCIDLYDVKRVKSGAYELSMGYEYYTTNSKTSVKSILKEGEQFVIEPGQFALLLTKEIITIPRTYLGFISIKAGIKFQGLINVSGFHVDPGYEGRLKFSVYNAGSKPITLQQGQKMFPLWLAQFTAELSIEDAYDGKHQDQKAISGDDVSKIAGTVISPSVLNEKQDALARTVATFESNLASARAYFITFVGVLITLMGFIITKYTFADPNRTLQKEVDVNQKAIGEKFHKQDSILTIQGVKITRQDSIIQMLENKAAKHFVVDKSKL